MTRPKITQFRPIDFKVLMAAIPPRTPLQRRRRQLLEAASMNQVSTWHFARLN